MSDTKLNNIYLNLFYGQHYAPSSDRHSVISVYLESLYVMSIQFRPAKKQLKKGHFQEMEYYLYLCVLNIKDK